MRQATPVRVVLAALLVVSAGAFALAAREERSREAAAAKALGAPEGSPAREAAERAVPTTSSTTVAISPTPSTSNPLAAPEGSPGREAAERSQLLPTTSVPPTSAVSPSSTSSTTLATPATIVAAPHVVGETLFGVRTESPATTALVVVVLLIAAVLAVAARRRSTLLGIIAVAGVLALLDAREALHQHDEGRTSLVVAAVGLAVAHATASGLGLVAYRKGQ
jgi:hypothetical protein